MFEKILLPLPSVYYPEKAVDRAINLAVKFKSKLIVEYILEKQAINRINNVSSGAVTSHSLEKMEEVMMSAELGGEPTLFFDRIESQAHKRNIKLRKIINEGIHSDEIMECIQNEKIDLVITEFHKDTNLRYRIFYDSPIPIWLEQNGNKIKEVYGVLTNVSPNKLVPGFSFKFSKKLKVPLHLFYIMDKTEAPDTHFSQATRDKLIDKIEDFGKKVGVDCEIDVVTQDISTFLDQEFKDNDSALVILGRFKKPVKLPFTSLDKKIEVSKKLKANVLMLK